MNSVIIANMALARIGQATITSLTEANSVGARYCNFFYNPVRQIMLRKFPWKFATNITALAQIAVDPVGWDYEYQQPADSLRILGLVDESGSTGYELQRAFINGEMRYVPVVGGSKPTPYDIRLDKIVTNLEEAYAVYTSDITDPNHFDVLFVDAFAWSLAVEIAMPITKKYALRTEAQRGFEKAFGLATAANGNEGLRQLADCSDILEARR